MFLAGGHGGGQGVGGGVLLVDVHQHEPVGVFELSGPDETPDRGRGGNRGLLAECGGTPGEDDQRGAFGRCVVEPFPEDAERAGGQAPRPGGVGGVRAGQVRPHDRVGGRVRLDRHRSPRDLEQGVHAGTGAEQPLGRQRPERDRVHRDHRGTRHVDGLQADAVRSGPRHPHAEHLGAGGVRADPPPREGHQRLLLRRGDQGTEARGVQGRVEKRRVHAEALRRRRRAVASRQRHFGEDFGTPGPHRAEPPERRSVGVARLLHSGVEGVHGRGVRVGRRPGLGDVAGRRGGAPEHAGEVPRPVTAGGLGVEVHRPPAVLAAGFADGDLDVELLLVGQHEG